MEDKNFFKLLCAEDGHVSLQACVHQTWKTYKTFSCLGSPKENDLLLYICHCKAVYSMKNGERFEAEHGDVVLMPTGTEYTLTVEERDKALGCTYGINFLLFDSEHRRVLLDSPSVISALDPEPLLELFQKMSLGFHTGNYSLATAKALFYKIVASLNDKRSLAKRKEFSVIEKGIHYLENDPFLLLPVSQIAAMCHVSQNYFCRLFKFYSGLTPGEYILKARIKKAKSLLCETASPISEIAELCGFSDPSYFCRLFKKKEGKSPLEYRGK